MRYDSLLGEWVIIAGHRQDRTYLPPADHCPLDPSRPGRPTEIPAPDYEVAVFENRFPSLVTGDAEAGRRSRARTARPGLLDARRATAGARWSASARTTRRRSPT